MTMIGSLRGLVTLSPPKSTKMWGSEFVRAQKTLSTDSVNDLLARFTGPRQTVWRRVSIRQALGVPAIHRAAALISSTNGMLSVQGYRNGVVMDGRDRRPESPRLVVRPDPHETPYTFYSTSAANMAKYGEIVWWIASIDGDGLASALVNVPLVELRVEDNPANRLLPKYTWGDKVGTRYSGANPAGRFVHIKYPIGEPLALRGEGPLQICGVANSVAVESQEWAANFYGEGGGPAALIKKVGSLSPVKLDPLTWLPMDPLDPEYETRGRSEGDLIRDQIIGRANNTTMVIDDTIDSVDYRDVNQGGAQMLDARSFNNGDAAREFGIPGPLLEYQQPGGSLTYQNRTELKGALIEMCLWPLYLEPMEQALSDLLPRSTVAKFNVKGFLRADIKTRFDVHGIAIDKGIYDAAYAQREEGIEPGDVEFAPVPFAAPQAIPAAIPRIMSSEVRDIRCPSCNRLAVRASGRVEAKCERCKTVFEAA
jgi:phage portal protein BeeE